MSMVKLGSIIKLEYGKPLDQSDRTEDGAYPAYGANGIKSHTNKFYYEKPSIIVGRKGSAGELKLTHGKFWPLDVTYYVTHDEYETDLKYIFYLLNTLDLPSLARGVKPGINRNDIYSIEVPLVPLPIQKKIVARLDLAFEKIDRSIELSKHEQLYMKAFYNSKLESIFLNQNEAEQVLIEDVCTIRGGKRLPKGFKLANKKTPWPYVRVSDFDHKGGIDLNKIQYLEERVQKQIERYIITDEDVFLSIAGSIGITGIVPAELSGANLTENACRLIPNQKIDKEYLYFFTLTKSFIEQAAGATRQTAQPKLALIRIKNIRLQLPDLKTQRASVMNLKKLSASVDSLKLYTDKKINYLQDLKQSMLNEAFSESAVK